MVMLIQHAFSLRRPVCFLFVNTQGNITSTARGMSILAASDDNRSSNIAERRVVNHINIKQRNVCYLQNRRRQQQQQQVCCYYSSSSIIQQQQNQQSNNPHQQYNPGLASVISQGINGLETTAAQIEVKTRRISLDDKKLRNAVNNVGVGGIGNNSSSSASSSSTTTTNHDEDNLRQLAEGHRIMTTITECLEDMCNNSDENTNNHQSRYDYSSLIINNEPISIIDVVVNRDLKHAKIYWTLPYGILMDRRVFSSKSIYDSIIEKINPKVSTQGQKLLQRHVHHKLRFYYPPKLRLIPATDDMVKQVLVEILSV